MDDRKNLDVTAYIWLMIFCISGSLQTISLKSAGVDISPLMQIALRSLIGATLIALYMLVTRENIHNWRAFWQSGLLSGLFFAVEYVLMGEALRFTTAARVSVFMYSAPLFAALILHFCVASERLSKWQWGGVLMAFSGIIATFWETDAANITQDLLTMLFGDFLALLGGFLWGFNIVIIRISNLKRASIGLSALFHLIPTFIILYLSSLILGQSSFALTNLAVLNVGFQTLFIACGGFLLWFWLLRTYSATRVSIFSFLTPLFTIIFAILLLDEPVSLNFIVGAFLVVSGLMITSLSKNLPQEVKELPHG